MTMIQNLSATLKAVERCWADNKIDIAICDSAKTILTKTTDSTRNHLITPQGLIDIDYRPELHFLDLSEGGKFGNSGIFRPSEKIIAKVVQLYHQQR